MRTGWLTHPRYIEHDTGQGHPERPDRLRAICAAVEKAGLLDRLTVIEPRAAEEEHLLAVHEKDYLERLEAACKTGARYIDVPDSAICRDSHAIARLSAGAGLAAIDAIMDGRIDNAFCAIRPPGHHCEVDRSMGFCLLNNAAIAARYAQRVHGLSKVLILDWDVHHGNGTQHIFESDPTVFYCSLHEHPSFCYPGTGYAWEKGEGAGEGATLNIPMPPNSTDAEYQEAFFSRFLPAARQFDPDLVIVSAGFDAHEDDPLASEDLTQACFDWMAKRTKELARQCSGGRLVSLLEGGYNLDVLATCVVSHLQILLQESEEEDLMLLKSGLG
ncbi:MAG: Histone deacetylase-like amidohydrolase [Phycisphaerae bacterium]|nr:Histone deacetylase-like amidohydrolase [Phycisphaerae bacterium]